MNTFTVIFVVLFAVWQVNGRSIIVKSPDNTNELDEDDEACINDLHLNRDNIAAVDMGGELPEKNEEFVKFMGCTGEKLGLISDGHISYDKIKEELFEVARNDPEFSPMFFRIYKQIVISAVSACENEAPTASSSGLVLVKALNCVTKQLTQIMES